MSFIRPWIPIVHFMCVFTSQLVRAFPAKDFRYKVQKHNNAHSVHDDAARVNIRDHYYIIIAHTKQVF